MSRKRSSDPPVLPWRACRRRGWRRSRPAAGLSQTSALITRPIPSSEEALPLVGLGSWITFNVGDDPVARDACADVMRAFFAVWRPHDQFIAHVRLGAGRHRLRSREARPSAGSVLRRQGLDSRSRRPAQIEESRALWGVPNFDLLQVHNLLSWEEHLADAARHEGCGQASLCRHHHLGRPPP